MLNENVSAKEGRPATPEMLVDVARLQREYFERPPDIEDPNQLVGFGTNRHRGSSLRGSFNEAHILAITQAICDYRQTQRTKGPRYMGMDTQAISYLAQRTALEVLAANQIESVIQRDNRVTPTPAISRTILSYNRKRKRNLADAIVVPPPTINRMMVGFKYNPPHRGPDILRVLVCGFEVEATR